MFKPEAGCYSSVSLKFSLDGTSSSGCSDRLLNKALAHIVKGFFRDIGAYVAQAFLPGYRVPVEVYSL